MVLARRYQGLECSVLLLYELGAVQDNNVWHRRPLRRKPVLPWASGTAAAAFRDEATPSPARPKRFGVSTPERLARGKQGWLSATKSSARKALTTLQPQSRPREGIHGSGRVGQPHPVDDAA